MGETALITAGGDPIEYAMVAWLHAKTTRTGSAKTERAYRDTIQRFRWALQSVGLDLDGDPARIADVAQAWAARPWDSQKRDAVTAATTNQRLAILSSFYAFAHKRRILAGENPLDLVDRRPTQEYDGARALDPGTVAESLQAIDRSHFAGKRDYALLATLLYTGRRLSEVLGMTWADVTWHNGCATVTFPRAKGGKKMTDTLPLTISTAIAEYVQAVHVTPNPETVIWVSLARNHFGMPLSKQAVGDICFKHLGTSKVHLTRHTFAHSMEQVGAKLSDIQARLGHSNAATTSKYLASLRSAENQHGGALASLLGLDN